MFLYRYAQQAGQDTTVSGAPLAAFADAARISAYAAEAVQWAVARGLLTGTDSTTLSPQGSATRAQAAAILVRFAQLDG